MNAVRNQCLVAVAAAAFLAACAIERSKIANDAQGSMIGLPKEQILACMGPPARKDAVGATEVWSYDSGNNFTAASYGNGFATASTRHCTVNVTMTSDRVSAVNYLGPTGGVLSPNEQCAFAVEACRRTQ
jgi:hypothetical protein